MRRCCALLVSLLWLAACGISSSEAPSAPLELGVEGTLRVGASTAVKGADIAVRLVEVSEDSRCPRDTQCTWAGEVKLELEARVGSAPPVQRQVLEGRSMLAEPYRITVIRVLPDPVSTKPTAPGDYRVMLIVSNI